VLRLGQIDTITSISVGLEKMQYDRYPSSPVMYSDSRLSYRPDLKRESSMYIDGQRVLPKAVLPPYEAPPAWIPPTEVGRRRRVIKYNHDDIKTKRKSN